MLERISFMLKLGNIELDVPFFQAPLSGYTDFPMRRLAMEHGAPLTFTGVLLDKIAMHHKAVKKLKFQPGEGESPVGAQILGANPETMAGAAKSFVNLGYDLIDLNFACPAPKVLRRRRGGYMLNEPDTAIEIFRRVRDAVDCPILIKVRIGFDDSEESRENFWKICQTTSDEGIDALVIHGRTVKQKYRGKSDWEIIGQAKERFPGTTIIGSGDLMAPETIVHRLQTSGADGVIIARGAIGNPWIFDEARALLKGEPKPKPPTVTEQGKVVKQHFDMILQQNAPRKAIPYFRKFAASYCKRHPQRKKTLMALMTAKNTEQLYAVIKEFYGV